MTAFHDQYAARIQVACRLRQHNAHGVQPVLATGEGERWFVPVFMRQGSHDSAANVGRIGDDQVVAALSQRAKIV